MKALTATLRSDIEETLRRDGRCVAHWKQIRPGDVLRKHLGGPDTETVVVVDVGRSPGYLLVRDTKGLEYFMDMARGARHTKVVLVRTNKGGQYAVAH